MLPRLKWLIFQMPMSSPQRIRILGFFSAIARLPFRKSVVGTRAGAMAETDEGGNLPSRVGCRNWTKVQPAAGTWRGQPVRSGHSPGLQTRLYWFAGRAFAIVQAKASAVVSGSG